MTVFIETPSPPRQEEKPKDEPMETEPEPEPEVDLSMKQVRKHCVLIILPAYPQLQGGCVKSGLGGWVV